VTPPSALAARAALERLGKWRSIFAGWQLGTRPNDDPECQAVRDAAEARLMLRAEVTAVVNLLTERGVFTEDEWFAQLAIEADMLSLTLEERFPGVRATDTGLDIDARAAEWMAKWKP
jgi:hypothetical protein